jgi:hypothetical protein
MNEVIDLLQSLMQQAAELADELSEEEMANVLQIFKDAIELIQGQAGGVSPVETPQTEQQQPSGVNHGDTPYPSSNINMFKYDPKSGQLLVKFMGKDVANAGPTYSYEGVPQYLFDVLRRGAVEPKTSGQNRWHRWKKGVTPSHGAAMAALIKAGGFPYKKISQ